MPFDVEFNSWEYCRDATKKEKEGVRQSYPIGAGLYCYSIQRLLYAMIETSAAILTQWQCYASLGTRYTGGAPIKIGRCPVGQLKTPPTPL